MPWIQGGPGEGGCCAQGPRDTPGKTDCPSRPLAPGAAARVRREARSFGPGPTPPPPPPRRAGRSPGRQSRAGRPGREKGPPPRLRHQFPGCSLGPSRGCPWPQFPHLRARFGGGGAERDVLLPFCIADCGGVGGCRGRDFRQKRIPEASGLAARHSPRRSKSCRSPRAPDPLYTLLPQDKELADWPTPPPTPPMYPGPPFPGSISTLSTLDPSIQQALNKHGPRALLESYSSVASLSLPLPFWSEFRQQSCPFTGTPAPNRPGLLPRQLC